jgi:hypothetical protein
MKNNRRQFLKLTGLAGLVMGTAGFKPSQLESISENSGNEIKFISPIDGDMLNEYDGTVSDGKLIIKLKIAAPSGSSIRVNGLRAKYVNEIFEADISLIAYENVIELVEEKLGYKKNITIYWLKNYANKYRLSLDDNIWFLKDIYTNADRYKSIFENPYLGFLKQVHDTYSTKIHLNLFYQTEGFNLSQMTDKFKNEWKSNAEWLSLSFHGLEEFPDRPYTNAGYNQVKKDCEMVMQQIRRFAGEEVIGPVTTLHWGEANVEGCRALRDCRYKALVGDFNVNDPKTACSYYLNDEQMRHVWNRFIWRDNKEGIIFTRFSLVINKVKLEQLVPDFNNLKKKFKPRYIELLIHEQYFYPDYFAYQPDFREKVMTSVKWAVDNGYKTGFLKESVFE